MNLLHDVGRRAAERYADSVAFESAGRSLSFEAFFKRAESLAGALEKLGVRRGDRVAILAQNCVDYLAYHYGTAMIGAMLLVLNIRHTVQELAWILNNAEACGLIVDEALSSQLPELVPRCSSIRFTVGIGHVADAGHSTEELAGADYRPKRRPVLSEKAPVLLIYTSGTTGRPKGALQTHEGSVTIDRLTADAIRATERDVYLAFMPYFHQAGLIRSRATMLRGGRNIVEGKLDPQRLARLIVEQDVTITMLVPPIDKLLTEIADRENLSLPALRLIIGAGGAGPAHAGRMRAFCEKFDCDYLGVYGQTEVTGPATVVTGDVYFKNPHTCGRPMPGIDLQIWDELHRPLPPGEVGEIMIRGRTTVPGYWKNEAANRDLYTGEWLHTGDLARLDEEGFLYFVDRKKELIKTGAENVYPREVEAVLETHPAVADLAVIGLPDPEGWGEVVVAVIVPKAGKELTLEGLRNFCRGKIAGYKIPKKLWTVEEIPRNVTGKVKKLELRERLSDGAGP